MGYKNLHDLSPVCFASFISYYFPCELTSHNNKPQLFIQHFQYASYFSKPFAYIKFSKLLKRVGFRHLNLWMSKLGLRVINWFAQGHTDSI